MRKELDQQFYDTYGLLLQNKIMIHLRLNKNDSDKRLKKLNCELLKSLDDAVLALNENRCPNHDAMNDKIINPAGDILKLEWCRVKEGANKRGNSSRLTQSFHFFMFEPIFSPVNALNQPI
ncbi:hypothetical protein C0073_013450 [Aeromonas veronii]|nr:hypothetical protein C0073_013450 [Aeromonas veronii]